MPARVGLLAQAVRPRGGLVADGIGGHDRLAALRKAVILSISLTPGVVSTPEETSTSRAPVRWIASATLAGLRPPVKIVRASCWARVCPYFLILVVSVSLNKKL